MKNYFKIREFFKQGLTRSIWLPTALRVITAIEKHFVEPLNKVREIIGAPVVVNSGYRPKWYELARLRSGSSEHTFKDRGGKATGAADITTVPEKRDELREALCKDSPFRRVAWYPVEGFFHVDYKGEDRRYFEMQYNEKGKPTGWKCIRSLCLLWLLSSFSYAQDTTRTVVIDTFQVDTIRATLISRTETVVVMPGEPTQPTYIDALTPQMFGAVANDSGFDDAAFVQLFAAAGAKKYARVVIPSGFYRFRLPLDMGGRQYEGEIRVSAFGAVFLFELDEGQTLFNWSSADPSVDVAYLIDWDGGEFRAVRGTGNVFSVAASYGMRIANVRNVMNVDTFFIGRFILGSDFERIRFVNSGLGFFIEPIGGAQFYASTNINVRACRFYGTNATGFFHARRAYMVRAEDNIVEGAYIEHPFKFNFMQSGVSRNAFIIGNHIETKNKAVVMFEGGNGVSVYLERNYISEESAGIVVDAQHVETPHTVYSVYLRANFIGSETAQFRHDDRATGYWHFSDQEFRQGRGAWIGKQPYYNRVSVWERLR